MKLVLKNMNKMYYKGSLFNPHNKSYYGYRIDLLKSALQKYLRRKELDKIVKNYFDADGFPLTRNPTDLVFFSKFCATG